MWKTSTKLFQGGSSEPFQCPFDEWRLLVKPDGSLYFDMTSVAKKGLSLLKDNKIEVLPSGSASTAERGILLHRIEVGGEEIALAITNFGIRNRTASTAKFAFFPPMKEHKRFFEHVVKTFRVTRIWFLDHQLSEWFAKDSFYSDFKGMMEEFANGGESIAWAVPLAGPMAERRRARNEIQPKPEAAPVKAEPRGLAKRSSGGIVALLVIAAFLVFWFFVQMMRN